MAAHRVVIVGGGFGGLAAAKALRRAPVDVTLVDRQAHHLFQPLLYQVATGVLSQGNIAPPLRDVLRHQRNAQVVLAEVGGVDLERRVVECSLLDRTWELAYDSLIVAAGSAQSYFGRDEFALHAPGMKTIDDALEVRGRIFGAFELAELEEDPLRRSAWLTFVVVGAGPTGVEMAGQIAELSRYSLRSNFRRIDTADARIVLLDGAPRILPSFDERLARRAAAKLERMGVEIRTGTLVTGMDAEGVELKTSGGVERLAAMTKIWSAGVQASPLGEHARHAGGRRADAERARPRGARLHATGPSRGLRRRRPHVARRVARSCGGRDAVGAARGGRDPPAPRREPRSRGPSAIAISGASQPSRGTTRWASASACGSGGSPGWLLWLVVHLTFLTGFKNRVSALFHWTISFFGRSRPERTITAQQVFARAGARRVQPRRCLR